jgi:hypothetical protein
MQMLAAAPPATWQTVWKRPPAALIGLARGEWQFALWSGWSQAAQRHRDAEWSEALLRAWLSLGSQHEFRDLWLGLFPVLPVERRESLVRERLREEGDGIEPETAALLQGCDHAWSPELTRAVMESLRRYLAAGGRVPAAGGWAEGEVRELLREAVHHIPPALGPEVAAGWTAAGEDWGAWDEAVGAFLTRLRFRHEMLKELQ